MNSLLQQYIKLYRAVSEIKTLQSRIATQKLEKGIDKLKQEIEESTTDVIHHGTLQRTLRLMEQQLENAASINIQVQRISALLSSCEETFSALLNALMHAQAMASAGAMIDVLSEVKFVQENIFTINQESASFEQAMSEVMRMSL